MATYNGSDKRLQYLFQNGGGGGSNTLDGLSDVNLTTPTDGQVLAYDANADEWVNSSSASPSSIASMSDTDIQSPTNGQTLVYNGTSGKWENASGGGGSTHTYSTTEQVVGTWIDGKPLYEIVVQYTTTPTSNGWTQIPLPIDCLVQEYSVYYHRENPYRNTKASMFRITSPENEQVIANIQEDTLWLYVSSAFIANFTSVDIILRYTKSTD